MFIFNIVILVLAIAMIIVDTIILAVADHKNRIVAPVLRSYPPTYESEELMPYDVAAVFNIGANTKDKKNIAGMGDIVASMMVQLSIEGCIKIREDRYEILKPYYGNDEYLRKIFNRLISYGDHVYIEDLEFSDFCADVYPLYQKWLEEANARRQSFRVIPAVFALLSNAFLILTGKTVMSAMDMADFNVIGLETIAMTASLSAFLVSIITACRATTCDREYRKLLAEINGYRRFLSTSEKAQLMKLFSEDLKYITKTVPYACALGLTPAFTEELEESLRKTSRKKMKRRKRSEKSAYDNEYENIAEKYVKKP